MILTVEVRKYLPIFQFLLINKWPISTHIWMASGYRSPLRPIPLDIIPEMVHEYRNDHECVPYGDENMTSSCITDSWWLEAIRVADDVENKKIDISNMLSCVRASKFFSCHLFAV